MKKRHHVKNAWWVSPYADLPELRKGTTPGSVQLYDYTLRAWGRGYGMIYDATEVARMVDKLATIGVERIELGLPDEESLSVGDVRNVVEAYPDIQFSTRLHGGKKDVQAAAECGIKQILISIPLGYPQIKYRLGWTWETSLEKMLEATEYAREIDLQVIAAPGDIARSAPEDLDRYLKTMHKQAPPDAFCVEDTTGCALPQVIDHLVRRVRQHLRAVPIQVSTGNDFGLATACAISGVLAGAQVAHGSLNGLGKRLGGAPTEELLLCFKILLGTSNAYAVEPLHEACLLAEELTGIPIRDNKPFASHRSYFSSAADSQHTTEHPLLTFATDPRIFGRTVQSAPHPKQRKSSVSGI